jgi:DNA-binding GntR family transcriptional regulator
MDATPRGGAPQYARIADRLRAQIAAGDLRIGDRVPSEPTLIDEYRVSKTTAAKALDRLAAEGLIERRTGAGSFVVRVPEMTVIEVGPGTRITATAGPVIIVERPGAPPERHQADTTIIVVTAEPRP